MKKRNQLSQTDMIKQAAMKRYAQTIYCAFCGRPVLLCSTDEHGRVNSNIEWEIENNAHYPCFLKDMQKKGYR